ncbi:MAG TPA: hydroxymethylbilane synthase [Chthonomonadaceae bacterium]|nr:hydroxymethylbilane synthase [Chthonomonadaceae bacterium]
MTASRQTLRIGTRGSLLAHTQTQWVIAQLQQAHPGLEIALEIIETTGDMRRDVPFTAVGTKGMFVKEIEQALLDGSIDVGVHSLKDMPSEQPDGLELACVPKREDPHDALISRNRLRFDALAQGAVVGTSSVRRQAQLRLRRPDLKLVELRGNLDTRLRKLDAGEYDAIVVACAGLHRLGLAERIVEPLSPQVCVPAAGQGALALETRAGDSATVALLTAIHDPDTALCVEAERAFLAGLGGGCSVPAGALATLGPDGWLILEVIILAPDGSHSIHFSNHQELGYDPQFWSKSSRSERASPLERAIYLGEMTAQTAYEKGADRILKG